MIHYGAGKLANVKETLNGVVGIERFAILFHGSFAIKQQHILIAEEEVL